MNIKVILTALLLVSTVSIAQQEAGIFNISFQVDEELRNELEASHKERNFLSGYSERPHFPEALINEMKDTIAHSVGKVLNANAECVYKINRKGDTVYTIGLGDELEGMPVDRKNKAIESHDKDLYVRVDVYIRSSGGVSVGLPNGTKSRLKPMIKYVVKVYNKEGKKVFKEKTKIKNFGVLKSTERDSENGEWRVKESEILHPEDIYAMLLKAIEQFEEENM